jgi:DNA-binding MarR family transcriptional regulator
MAKPVDRNELLGALGLAMREMSALSVLHSQAIAAALGINSTDLECLDFVVMRGPATAGTLAEITGLTTGAITGVIDRLEKARFVRRVRDPGDRRKVLVEVLPAVRRRIDPLGMPMQRAMFAALGAHKTEDLELLLEVLTGIRDAAQGAIKEVREASAKRALRRARSVA